jgi:uncharacterized delta-60 repeat protein
LARYNANGTLDTSFNGDGKLTTDFGESDAGLSVAVQSDGKIVVAGTSGSIYADFAVARYNADGTLDTSFSSDGKLTTDFGTRFDICRSVAVQSDAKIVVAGNTDFSPDFGPPNADFALARYNADGTLDTLFDSDGLLTTDFGGASEETTSVVVQSDGKIIVAGSSRNGTNTDFAVARYNPNGALDTSFDGDGRLTTAFGAFDDHASEVVVQSDGKIVAAGASYNGADQDFAVARYEGDAIQPALLGDYNLNNVVDAADYIVWRKSLNTMGVTPFSGADGNGDGTVDEDDYGVWREHFGQTSPPPAAGGAAGAAAKMNSPGLQVSDANEAVEARGASEKQRAMSNRESSIFELAAPSATRLAEASRTVRSSPRAKAVLEASQRDDGLLMWITHSDSKNTINDWEYRNWLEEEALSSESDSIFNSFDEVFELRTSG